MSWETEYERWLEIADDSLQAELKAMDEATREDAFYRDLAFGTGGLRGVLGPGTNRMNTHVVGKASQGLSDYLNRSGIAPSVVIGYDSRINSELFARTSAGVFAANGIRVWIWPELLPVPTVSYAVRHLKASAGVMITASHNPSRYNGYKVYGPDGCQITTETASAVLKCISAVDVFDGVKAVDFDAGLTDGSIRYIDAAVLDGFITEIKGQSVLFGDEANRDVTIVYTPLNGTGLKPVTRVLSESGFTNVTVVAEQRDPDGHFPTCPYPNPEIREAMELGLQYARRTGAELLLATDPDCDRCGIAVRADAGNYRLLTGNEVGLLLLDFICSQRTKHGKMPKHPVFVKTIVTMDLAEKIAAHWGVETVNVLTGFKFIGEVIGRLEQQGQAGDYLFGFEESYGYLSGTYVRDKDGVDAAFMICEMFAYYKLRGVSLLDRLNEIYRDYGYCLNTLHSFEFPGSEGMHRMQAIMEDFRRGVDEIAGQKVLRAEDYSAGLYGLPKSDVLKYIMKDGSVVIRPSGTEPKLKLYISVTAANKTLAEAIEARIAEEMGERMKNK